ncbi:MAG: histidinol-phosphatase [Cyclobacteriaceae bacterium]
MRPILFIDRDGTIIQEIYGENMDRIEKITFLDDVLYYLRKIQQKTDFLLVMVTNQDGLGTSAFPEKDFWPIQDFIIRTLKGERIHFDAVHIDPHFESDNHQNRKPGIGMLRGYLKGEFDIANSYVIGDRLTDVELAKNLGCQAIHISDKKKSNAALTAASWKEIFDFLCS